MKCNNIHITGLLEGEEKEQGRENLFEKMTENFPNMVEKLYKLGITEGTNQDEPKEAHSKTHYN